MFISKSLFVDYSTSPKLAWWKKNNKETYNFICWIDNDDISQGLIELGQNIEDRVWEYLLRKYGTARTDVFLDNPFSEDREENDNRDEELLQESYLEKKTRNLEQTLEAIKRKEPLIYQAAFEYNNLFVRVDYLRLNENGNYDIIEVKAKSSVRKDKTFEKCKNKWVWELETCFLADISFQNYVVKKVFERENLWEIDDVYFAYLNYRYKLWESLNILKLIVLDKIENWAKNITLESEENSKIATIDDTLLSNAHIEAKVQEIQENLILSEEDFNVKFPFSWSKYIEYFWKERPFGTIYGRGVTKADAVKTLHYEGKENISDLSPEDISLFEKRWGGWSTYEFIQNYLKSKNKNTPLIEADSIRKIFSELNFPLCFYDYETVSVPVPYITGTTPYQQVIVQYSIHKVYEDGKIEHFSGIYTWDWKNNIEEIEIAENTRRGEIENEKLISGSHQFFIETFLADIWEHLRESTFIVWYKPFENSRNKEAALMYPELADSFELINEATFDLMDIYKKWYYFDTAFQGSNSIKYVLPVMVPEMSYTWMNVPDGWVAMRLLDDIVSGRMNNEQEKREALKDLLLYCGQDSLAMYKIYEEILRRIN